jgi:hypothetical protein
VANPLKAGQLVRAAPKKIRGGKQWLTLSARSSAHVAFERSGHSGSFAPRRVLRIVA